MQTVFVIGGMGSGKSTARKALVDLGLACIDFDAIGHQVLELDAVKADLARAFGDDVIDCRNNVDRRKLAERAFANDEATSLLNSITLPRIDEAFRQRIAELEAEECPAVVAEASNFQGRNGWLVHDGDIVLAITAPLEQRIARAVAAGWDEDDVRRRIARQMSDDVLAAAADAVIANDGTPDDLRKTVQDWWRNAHGQEPR